MDVSLRGFSMPTVFRKGNAVSAVINGEIDVLLHCANCQALMGSGIAAEIAERIPSARQVDYEYASAMGRTRQMLGTYSSALVNGEGSGKVFNLYGQFQPGLAKRALNYGAITAALLKVKATLDPLTIVGIPYKMGCDRAGGDWDIMLEIVEFVFRDTLLVIYSLDN